MGDRCYLEIYLHGSISSLSALEEIGDVLRDNNFESFDCPRGMQEKDDFLLACALAMGGGKQPMFHHEECNYADVTDIETVLIEHRVPFHVSHDSGSDYGPAQWAWSPEDGPDPAINGQRWNINDSGDGVVMTVRAVEKAVADGTIDKIIDEAWKATGRDLPPWAPEGEVKEELARLLALEVLTTGD